MTVMTSSGGAPQQLLVDAIEGYEFHYELDAACTL